MRVIVVIVIIGLITAGKSSGSSLVERYALISGVNNGGSGREVLKYAVDDAVDFANVMFEMGGLSEKNTIVLKDPAIDQFYKALHSVNNLIKIGPSGSRKELLIYYSGHADEIGLLFGNQCFDYRKLRQVIDSIASDVKITILDACASGSITRIKGGTRKKAFLVDASSDLTGYAFITSSSESEVSQESDKINGSFFTHFLVSGLRGAADMSSDWKITLSEAYQFAFHETLAGTESTSNGPQHPSYDMRLTGSGDVVMTDIRSVNAIVKFPSEVAGRICIRNANNQLIAELMKQKGKVVEIGLPGGEITVQLSTDKQPQEGKFTIVHDSVLIVTLDQLKGDNIEKKPYQKKGSDIQLKRFHRFAGGIVTEDSLVLKGIALSFAGNIAYDTVMGIQNAFFSNESYKPLIGLQHARLGNNLCKNTLTGIQLGLISNVTELSVSGSQIALIRNSTWKQVHGMQMSFGVNTCYDSMVGVQCGLVSYTKKGINGVSHGIISSTSNGSVNGLQIGLHTFAEKCNGVQIAPVCNTAGPGGMMGVQIAGFMNVAKSEVHGVQWSPLLNVAADVKGMQLSLVNVADTVRGVQVGLINISEDMYGYPIGLFNYSKKGVFALWLWYDEQNLTNITLQSGTRHFYNLFTAAIASNGCRGAGFGMGSRVPLKYVAIESDINQFITFRHLNADLEIYDLTEKIRITITTRFIPLVSISTGLSYNCLFNFDRKHNVDLNTMSKRAMHRIDQGIYTWPGFHFGLAFGRF